MNSYTISKESHKKRLDKIKNWLEGGNLSAMIFFNPMSVYYLTGYRFIPTERPICLVVPTFDEPWFFIPRLEVEHIIEKIPWITYEYYFEYPDLKHPANIFVELLRRKKLLTDPIALESSSFSAHWGYKGPLITDLLKDRVQTRLFPHLIMDMRKIKDEEELKLIRESAKWGHLAHKLLQEYTKPGKNEVEVSLKASWDATKEMLKKLEDFIPNGTLSAYAGYRGQIGEWSAIPHSVLQRTKFKEGQTLVTGASANVSGYLSELERTMFIGKPNDKQRRYFRIMKKAQDAALDTFAPGIPCSEVDKAARKVFKEEGVFNLVLHHTGHSIGLEGHEPPFLDIGVDEIIRPGMVFTCEPGIYEHRFSGFRHSDTVIIHEDGAERITLYPREIEDLII